jgi:hypothetical protein
MQYYSFSIFILFLASFFPFLIATLMVDCGYAALNLMQALYEIEGYLNNSGFGSG